VLEWLKNDSQRFSNLALMARDLLSIFITAIASESAFSTDFRILNKYKNCLLPEDMKQLFVVLLGT